MLGSNKTNILDLCIWFRDTGVVRMGRCALRFLVRWRKPMMCVVSARSCLQICSITSWYVRFWGFVLWLITRHSKSSTKSFHCLVRRYLLIHREIELQGKSYDGFSKSQKPTEDRFRELVVCLLGCCTASIVRELSSESIAHLRPDKFHLWIFTNPCLKRERLDRLWNL